VSASNTNPEEEVEAPLTEADRRTLERVSQTFSSHYWRWELKDDALYGSPIEEVLYKRLPHIDARSWPARFELGGVYLAGRQATFGQIVYPPSRLEYYEPKLGLERVAEWYPAISPESIVYRDEDLAVVLKPAGLPSTPPRDQNRYHLQGQLERLLGQPVHLPSRLDTGVAGLLIASLSSRMNRFLQRAYDAKKIEKYYLCEVGVWPEWDELMCEAPISRDPRHPVLRRCASEAGQGISAVTRLHRLAIYKADDQQRALLQAEPITGRTHQIRLHCAWEGMPILGDPYYSDKDATGGIRLTSYALRLLHPYRAAIMSWELPRASLPEWMRVTGPLEIRYRVGQ
jgi:23S rRNA-/tRNA-specific pseudouridylate synthase